LWDSKVGSPAAYVARHRRVDIRVARTRVLCKKCCRGHDLSRLTVAALRHLACEPRLLHRGADGSPADAFDRGDRLAFDCGERRDAGARCGAVDEHRTCAAQTETATEL